MICDTHMKTWVVVKLKTVRQWKKQPSIEKGKNPKSSELIVDRPITFFFVTVTQLIFDGWGFKGSIPHRCLVSLCIGSSPGLSQETASWLGVCVWCRCIGGFCSSGCCPGCQELSAECTESSVCILALFVSQSRLVFFICNNSNYFLLLLNLA